MASAGRSHLFFVLFTLLPTGQALNGFFWHVTDFHLDLNYSTDGDPNSMCWKGNGEQTGQQLFELGNYQCDSPYKLVKSAVRAMREFSYGKDPDFILWTGDDKAHVGDHYFNEDKVVTLIANLTKTLHDEFPEVPLVPVLGNHDYYPTHLMPPRQSNLYMRISDLWDNWLGEDKKVFQNGGFYSKTLPNGVVVVVLNTVLYYKKNKQVDALTDDDPANQFSWLRGVLQKARSENKMVYITSHVPPGVFERHIMKGGFQWFHDYYNKRFIKIVVEFSDVIIAQFFAHQHTDTFRVIYSPSGWPVSYLLMAPSVTPWNTTLSQVGPNNPGVRKVYYNQQTGHITNYEQYYLNLGSSNDMWALEYSAREAYSLQGSITPLALDKFTKEMARNTTTFNRYYLYNSVSYEEPVNCDSTCRHYHLCAARNVDFDQFEKCRTGALGNNPCDNSGNTISGIYSTILVSVLSVSLPLIM